jgi:hypothetical protein
MRRTIEFTYELPERETDACPSCSLTELDEREKRTWHVDPNAPLKTETLAPYESGCELTRCREADCESCDGAYKCKDDWHEGEKTVELPAMWDICNRCKGEGTHINPNIDGHGITGEEWYGPDWDDESREAYMSGGYDVACEAGCTAGKVLVPDEEACKQEPLKSLLEKYKEQQDRNARYDREDRHTRYMESGGREGSRW